VFCSEFGRRDRLQSAETRECRWSYPGDAGSVGASRRRGCLHQHQVHGSGVRVVSAHVNSQSIQCSVLWQHYYYYYVWVRFLGQYCTTFLRILIPACQVCDYWNLKLHIYLFYDDPGRQRGWCDVYCLRVSRSRKLFQMHCCFHTSILCILFSIQFICALVIVVVCFDRVHIFN